jgi:hypothetical protein
MQPSFATRGYAEGSKGSWALYETAQGNFVEVNTGLPNHPAAYYRVNVEQITLSS